MDNTSPESNRSRLSILGLSAELGISRTTLHRHLAKPNAPARGRDRLFAVAEVKAWMAEHSAASGVDSVIEALRTQKLRLEVERMERENAIARGELVRISDIEPAIRAFGAKLTAALEQIMVIELPQKCVGLDVIESRTLHAAAADRVIMELKAGKWAQG